MREGVERVEGGEGVEGGDNGQPTTDNRQPVERDALLFRAGSYPDKDIVVTEEDLDRMVENYSPAPIKVEHTDTPLRFGVVTRIWRVGRELFGRLAFNPLAWALARECGATRLSVAVRRDKTGLQEVSLVRSPRIADAAVFGSFDKLRMARSESRDTEYFAGEDLGEGVERVERVESEETEGGDFVERQSESILRQAQDGAGEQAQDSAGEQAQDGAGESDAAALRQTQDAEFADRVATLERELRAKDVDAKIDDLKRKGKLSPAAETLARSLLMAPDDQVVTFADPSTGDETREGVAKTFEAFLEAQPKVIEFSELAPEVDGFGKGVSRNNRAFSSEDEKLFERLGVSPETVERHRERKS